MSMDVVAEPSLAAGVWAGGIEAAGAERDGAGGAGSAGEAVPACRFSARSFSRVTLMRGPWTEPPL